MMNYYNQKILECLLNTPGPALSALKELSLIISTTLIGPQLSPIPQMRNLSQRRQVIA